ncbi:hypothetical protein [Dactylosporangium matsuzakiense]|uniref:Uncharacterized protein n=1 Tax=Dactylosporangium matsuzakiense TaxID=53360 RepID=A0A9W6NR55_9ACTN|nr:hypothetical protein [Dactylosporangium matsuzakiense]UWZ44796.1 hypothetical protein Dmats_47040 [Dactylosporangium matsuzakiense]GLL06058.1 hypothetical protein GCM10017581_078060 [Dactylosporangium matsuzakiense]
MADFDDQILAGAFADFRNEVAPHVKPAGTAAAQQTVHRRHRVKTIAATTLAALAIAAPVVAYAAVGDSNGPPPVVPGESATVAPTEAAPTTADSPTTPAASQSSAAPDGKISKTDLGKATLDIPAWPGGLAAGTCPEGKVKFTDGKAGYNGVAKLKGDLVYVDVDHDGAQETVALIECTPQGSDFQVIAFDRDAGGKIVTLGRVVGSAGSLGKEGTDIETIWAIAAGDNGQVRVDVGDYRPCCDMIQASQHQWRTYGWNGTKFTQTGGPTAFGTNPNVTALTMTADKLTMTKQADGTRTGTLKVTIHNEAQVATPDKVRFSLDIEENWQAQAGSECTFQAGASPRSCTLPILAAGASRVVTIQLTAPAGPLSTRCTLYVHVVTANDGVYPDRKADNSVSVQVVEG